ncbi:hypothetical protein FVE85_5171 [Porphyridium purpureum]|uniref:DUF2415 domain-containing protein n=1 Tax=Porphyridium purpureum TaxID=35688 RepID=A0A5J4Z1T2_PORPP|nr:hypothetical protein FVE85_5171 [Porphyridium purpureum]|eukprot:POR0702..scf295_1
MTRSNVGRAGGGAHMGGSRVVVNEDAPRLYAQRSSIQHWQLRDLLTVSPNTGHVYFVQDSTVRRLTPRAPNRSSAVVENYSFLPTCMAIDGTVLAAGGQCSELKVTDVSTGAVLFNENVGGLVNNAVHISTHGGETRLLVANNDETIKVYALRENTLRLVETIQAGTPVNNACVSPDGRWLCVTGDSFSADVYAVSAAGEYKLVTNLPYFSDSGMKISWSANSDKLAIASQEGCVMVFDVRTWRPLATLYSKQGACRCVKWAPFGELDLLAFSEHVRHMNIVDTRGDFSAQQTISLTGSARETNISGFGFSPDARHLYVGSDAHIFEYQVDVRARLGFPCGELA